ncbi:non-homologous end-joining DNA ligase [Nocardiopsis xinjiangensis]|uniref:non-homologous end-joining DNA ligase n=1 Tax=Nocardiopsis xinjiangensis TaxID=124285 RepID=UPI0004759968|nr:non-homologous end-joining DNA ligase [Nocardiopsis xinjiangensis]
MTPATQVRAGRRVVRVKRPDKSLFGEGGATKFDLARYYTRVAPLMLPQVRGRPVALERLPDGIDGERFYVKHPPAPDWVRHVRTSGGRMIMCQDTAALVWCADQAALTQHVWLSREPRLGRPDRMVLDLDPPGGGAEAFDACRAAAHEAREVLEGLGLAAYVMTTGSRGLHVHSPLRPELEDQEVRDMARAIAERVAAGRPDDLTTEVRKDARRGRLFVDYLRNGREQLAVAPYAVRARPGAPVATPVTWVELDRLESAGDFTIDHERTDCPFRGMGTHARSPRKALRRLG